MRRQLDRERLIDPRGLHACFEVLLDDADPDTRAATIFVLGFRKLDEAQTGGLGRHGVLESGWSDREAVRFVSIEARRGLV
jgi:hypothetical protein